MVACPTWPNLALQSIKLQNLSNDFVRPNILDIKLGTQLYDEDATPAKKERMIQAAMKTTSLETGVRMTGFQVCLRNYAISTRPPGLIASPICRCSTREHAHTLQRQSPTENQSLPPSYRRPLLSSYQYSRRRWTLRNLLKPHRSPNLRLLDTHLHF